MRNDEGDHSDAFNTQIEVDATFPIDKELLKPVSHGKATQLKMILHITQLKLKCKLCKTAITAILDIIAEFVDYESSFPRTIHNFEKVRINC